MSDVPEDMKKKFHLMLKKHAEVAAREATEGLRAELETAQLHIHGLEKEKALRELRILELEAASMESNTKLDKEKELEAAQRSIARLLEEKADNVMRIRELQLELQAVSEKLTAKMDEGKERVRQLEAAQRSLQGVQEDLKDEEQRHQATRSRLRAMLEEKEARIVELEDQLDAARAVLEGEQLEGAVGGDLPKGAAKCKAAAAAGSSGGNPESCGAEERVLSPEDKAKIEELLFSKCAEDKKEEYKNALQKSSTLKAFFKYQAEGERKLFSLPVLKKLCSDHGVMPPGVYVGAWQAYHKVLPLLAASIFKKIK